MKARMESYQGRADALDTHGGSGWGLDAEALWGPVARGAPS